MFRQNLSLVFLGTASGGGPSETRNCSSLVCDFMHDLTLLLVDCAEGTLRQFQFQPQDGFRYRANRVKKIFITHMHADHIMGIVPFLRSILLPNEAGKSPSYSGQPKNPSVEIYGPAGLRAFVRAIMKMTLTWTAETYCVHELLTDDDIVTPCDPPADFSEEGFHHNIANLNVMHVSETRGRDLRADENGFWKSIASARGRSADIVVDAGSIQHRDPCLGFVFRETSLPNRKIVILGDTYNPSQIAPLCLNPSPNLLVHEATDCPIPQHADRDGKLSKRVPEEVVKKAMLRGHSVPAMAGEFAKTVAASALVLNHIGARFPAPQNSWGSRAIVMKEIERQATEAWCPNSHPPTHSAVAAQDFLRVDIPPTGLAIFHNSFTANTPNSVAAPHQNRSHHSGPGRSGTGHSEHGPSHAGPSNRNPSALQNMRDGQQASGGNPGLSNHGPRDRRPYQGGDREQKRRK